MAAGPAYPVYATHRKNASNLAWDRASLAYGFTFPANSAFCGRYCVRGNFTMQFTAIILQLICLALSSTLILVNFVTTNFENPPLVTFSLTVFTHWPE